MERVEQAVQPRRGLHRGEQGTLRRRQVLLVLAERRGQHAPLPDAEGRREGAGRRSHAPRDGRTCRRSSSASRASSGTTHRAARRRSACSSSGESTERLAEISQEVAHRLSSVPGLEAVRSEAGTGEQEVQVVVNRDRASQLGLTTQDIAHDRGGRHARRQAAGVAHHRTRAHHAARLPRVRPAVRRRPGASARHAAGRLAHRPRRRRGLRRAAERPRNPARQPADHAS